MHNFKMSILKWLNSVLGFVSFINAVANSYLKQRINWSIWPCCQISKVSEASVFLNYSKRFPTASLRVDQRDVVCLVVAAGPTYDVSCTFSVFFLVDLFYFFESTACLLSTFALYFISVTCFQRQVYCVSFKFTIEIIFTYPARKYYRKNYFIGAMLGRKQLLYFMSLMQKGLLEGSQLHYFTNWQILLLFNDLVI